MENKKKVILFSLVAIISTMLFIVVMIVMIKENGKCVDDPFRYAAQKLNESGGHYACSCNSLSPELLDFTFSAEEGIKIVDTRGAFNTGYFNFSPEVKGGNE